MLVALHWSRDKDPRLPLGHASLLASLRRRSDCDVRSLVFEVNTAARSPDEAVSAVLNATVGFRPEAVDVAIGVYVWAEGQAKEIVAGLRRRGFAGRVILGGPQISNAARGVADLYPGASVLVRGYGEDALVRLANAPGAPALPGVTYAGREDAGAQAMCLLEELPSPWLGGASALGPGAFIRWETQRGCPYLCAFCQHREPGKRLRRRTLDEARIAAEIDLFSRSGVGEIAVLDPVFNRAPHATTVLKRFAERGFRGRLSLQCRAEAIDDGFLDVAAALNVRLEFGLQTIHPREGAAVRRRNQIERVDRVLAEVRRRGIEHEVSLIFGLPLQTLESFEQSVRWCLERRVPVIKAFPLLLLRGTALTRERNRWGLVDGSGTMPVVVKSASFEHVDWLAMARLSEALRLTEGKHPAQLDGLRRLAVDIKPTLLRWQPTKGRPAA